MQWWWVSFIFKSRYDKRNLSVISWWTCDRSYLNNRGVLRCIFSALTNATVGRRSPIILIWRHFASVEIWRTSRIEFAEASLERRTMSLRHFRPVRTIVTTRFHADVLRTQKEGSKDAVLLLRKCLDVKASRRQSSEGSRCEKIVNWTAAFRSFFIDHRSIAIPTRSVLTLFRAVRIASLVLFGMCAAPSEPANRFSIDLGLRCDVQGQWHGKNRARLPARTSRRLSTVPSDFRCF